MILEIPPGKVREAYRSALYGIRHQFGGLDRGPDTYVLTRQAFMDDDTTVLVSLDFHGFLTGAVSYTVLRNTVRIHALGSFSAGVGSELMEAVENAAEALDLPVSLLSTPSAEGFYAKRGYERVDDTGEMSKTTVRFRSKTCVRLPHIGGVLDSQFA